VAVALGYDPDSGRAPTVLATGRGTVAEQILAIAFAEGVKVREDADLAQLLAAMEVDSEIPVEAMAAVAEILSYLYRANGRLAASDGEGASPPGAAPAGAPFVPGRAAGAPVWRPAGGGHRDKEGGGQP
jgi:flagellar biosynthesis protein